MRVLKKELINETAANLSGLIVLFDMKGVGLRHLTRVKLWAVKKFFVYVQEGLPIQLKAIHVLNCVWFIDKILSLVKPFYKPELLELVSGQHKKG